MIETVELTGTIKQLFKNCPKPDGWFGCFFDTDDHAGDIKVTGSTQMAVANGCALVLLGHFTNADTFVALGVESIMDKKATIHYLSSPLFAGVGITTATKIYNLFGSKVLSIISDTPKDLKQLNLSDAIIETLIAGVGSRNVKHQLLKHFPMLKQRMIDELVLTYGADAVKKLKTQPYDVVYECESISFRIAHEIAGLMNINMTTRINECLQQAVIEQLADRGDSYLCLSDGQANEALINHTCRLLTVCVDRQQVIDAFSQLASLPRLAVVEINDQYLAYSEDSYDAEQQAASCLTHLLEKAPLVSVSAKTIYAHIQDYQDNCGVVLDGQQILAIVTAIKRPLSVITGGPGRGKTTILGCLIYCWQCISNQNVILAAPTGKAARRLTEAINNEDLQAETIMRQLMMARHEKGSDGREAAEKRKRSLVIIDECSMIGLSTAASMVELYKDSQVVLVGDQDQLPSIEAGQFFRDVCESKVIPVTKLSVCYRASDGQVLIQNADDINAGKPFDQLLFDPDTFAFTPFASDSDAYQTHLVDQYIKYVKDGVAMDQLCLLCATNNGPTGVTELNRAIQDKINPESTIGPAVRGYAAPGFIYWLNKIPMPFRVGDRVMQTKNHWDSVYDLYSAEDKLIKSGTGIFNGDCGTILEYVGKVGEESYIRVQMDDGRRFNITKEYISELKLAYAMTIHKSQGCEYQVVILSAQCSLSQSSWAVQNNFLTRNLFYTAVTRAKKVVDLVGSRETIQLCLDTPVAERRSQLQQRLQLLV